MIKPSRTLAEQRKNVRKLARRMSRDIAASLIRSVAAAECYRQLRKLRLRMVCGDR